MNPHQAPAQLYTLRPALPLTGRLSSLLTHTVCPVASLVLTLASPLSGERLPRLYQPVRRPERLAAGQGAEERPGHGGRHLLQTRQPGR